MIYLLCENHSPLSLRNNNDCNDDDYDKNEKYIHYNHT